METRTNNKQKQYNKKFSETHDTKQKTICPECSGCYTYFNKSRHLKTARHKLHVALLSKE